MAKERIEDEKGKHFYKTTDKDGVYRADKYTFKDGGKHEHRAITVDKNNGRYREYYGGENSKERSYNKKSSSSGK